MKAEYRLAVVVPAWNEAQTIAEVITLAHSVLNRSALGAFEIVAVDNGSTDATAAIARSSGAVLVSEPRRGYGQACLSGIARAAGADILVFMDADGSDDPDGIPRLVAPIIEGRADLVIGSRELGVSERGAHPWHAVLGTRMCVALMNLTIGTRATDLGPFRAIRAEALRELGMSDATFGWTTEMQIKVHRAGLRTVEVPVDYRRRRGGVSKISGSWPQSVKAGNRILGLILRQAFAQSPDRVRSGAAAHFQGRGAAGFAPHPGKRNESEQDRSPR